MMAKGEISAGFSGNAGLGRAGKPTAGWDAKKIPPADYPDLFPDAKSLEAAWFKKTGIYPMHGTIVVKDSVLREHPWVARSLHDAYSAAKNEWLAALRAGSADAASDKKYRELMPVVGDDPLPFGIERNRATIEALESYAFKQRLIPRRMSDRRTVCRTQEDVRKERACPVRSSISTRTSSRPIRSAIRPRRCSASSPTGRRNEKPATRT